MTEPVFVDTNVLVYRFDNTEPEKQKRCESWLDLLWSNRTGRVSIQVLQELYATLTRKLSHPLEPGEAQAIVRSLFSWQPIGVDRVTIESAWRLQGSYSLSWWDALIVAAAQGLGCTVLLTEDLSPGQVLDGIRVVNPFETGPADRLP